MCDVTEKCGARLKSGTGTCKHEAGWGTEHVGVGRCKLHGGAEAHAQVNGMVQLARREQAAMGMPLDIEPQDAILECIRIAAGEVAYASQRIAELGPGDVVGPVVTTVLRSDSDASDEDEKPERPAGKVLRLIVPGQTPPPATAADDAAQPPSAGSAVVAGQQEVRYGAPALHIWIVVRDQAMDRVVRYSAAALKAGVQERLVAVAESQAQLLAQAVRGILTDLGVAEDPKAPAIVRKHLTLISRTVSA